MEIKELSKGHKIFFNSDPINKDAVNYWLVTLPKMLEKNDMVLFAAFGGGFTWGSMLIKWA